MGVEEVTADGVSRTSFLLTSLHTVMLSKYDIHVETFVAPELVAFGESSPLFVVPALARPSGISFDRRGALIVASSFNHQLLRIHDDGSFESLGCSRSTSAGKPRKAIHEKAHVSESSFCTPIGLTLSPSGDILVVDSGNRCVRLLDVDECVSLFVGRSAREIDDRSPRFWSFVHLSCPADVCYAGDVVYVADRDEHCVRKINSKGLVTKIGQPPWIGGVWRFQDGGPGVGTLWTPHGLCASPSTGDVYITQDLCNMIRVIHQNDTVETFAGSIEGHLDGPTKDSRFFGPAGIVISPLSDILVADRFNHCIRLISANGIVTTLTGSAERGAKDGPKATFDTPFHMCFSPNGQDLYITDSNNFNIRRIRNLTRTQLLQRFSRNFNLSRIPSELLRLQIITVNQDGGTLDIPTVQLQLIAPTMEVERAKLVLECLLPQLSPTTSRSFIRLANGSIPIVESKSHHVKAELIVLLQGLGAESWSHTLLDEFIQDVKSDQLPDVSWQVMAIRQRMMALTDVQRTWIEALQETLDVLLLYLEDYPRDKPNTTERLSCDQKTHLVGELTLDRLLHQSFLAESLRWLLDQTTCANPIAAPDFHIECDGTSFPCHKWLMATRWTYVKRALEFTGFEVNLHSIDLTGKLPISAIQPLIHYIYTNDPMEIKEEEALMEMLRKCQEFDFVAANGNPVYGFEALMYRILSVITTEVSGDLSVEGTAKLKASVEAICSNWIDSHP